MNSCVAIQLKNLELERRLEEMEWKAGCRGTSCSCVAIQLKNQELERRLNEVEQKADSTGTTLPSVAIPELKCQELERRLEEMERNVGLKGTSVPCAAIELKSQELEGSLEKMAQLKAVLHKYDWKEISPGVSSAPAEVLLKIQLENRELEQKVAELEKGSSRVRNSASGEIHQKNEELERKVELHWKFAGLLQTERLKKLITASQELDLAFLIDATGSMKSTFEAIKENAGKIAAKVKKEWPQLKLRIAFAPYRDYGDEEKDDNETFDFQEDHGAFVEHLKRLRPGGESRRTDVAEDVFSGLGRAAQRLSWKSRTRVLVHIADAPCHGKQFHNFDYVADAVWDFFGETGDKRDIKELLRELREDRQIIRYLFCHLQKRYTEKMISVFRDECGDENWIQEEELSGENLSQLLDVVVKMCATSISLSMQVGDTGLVNNFDGSEESEEPGSNLDKWETIRCKQATQIEFKLPDDLDDLFKVLATDGRLERKESPDLMVQMGRNPFSREETRGWPGYCALVYELGSAPREMVVKAEYRTPRGQYENEILAKEAYFEQMEVHSVAARLAEEFNKKLGRDDETVQFMRVWTLKVGTKFYNVEKSLNPKPTRYPGNILHSKITEAYANTLHAFSHWTYDRSKGLLVVDDFQGLESGTDESNDLWLCDPALHCKDPLRYLTTKRNWGEPGMKRFLETHECNKICEALDLPSSKTAAQKLCQ